MDNYEQAVAREEENRRLARLGLARPLLGVQLSPITWRQAEELHLAGNAFFHEAEPTRDDVELFFWRLHPFFRRPDGTFPNLKSWLREPGARLPGPFAVFKARLFCFLLSRYHAPAAVEIPAREWVKDHWQDAPSAAESSGNSTSSLKAKLGWYDELGEFFAARNYTWEQFIDFPVSTSFLNLRTYLVVNGESQRVIPPSAALKRF